MLIIRRWASTLTVFRVLLLYALCSPGSASKFGNLYPGAEECRSGERKNLAGEERMYGLPVADKIRPSL